MDNDDEIFDHFQKFFNCKRELDTAWSQTCSRIIEDIDSFGDSDLGVFSPHSRQMNLNEQVVASIAELYGVAQIVQPIFKDQMLAVVDDCGLDSSCFHLAPLKGFEIQTR